MKLSNLRISNKDGKESVITQNKTTIQPTPVSFAFEDQSTTSSMTTLASLQDVSSEQLVEVKAKVTKISAVKHQTTRHNQTLQKTRSNTC